MIVRLFALLLLSVCSLLAQDRYSAYYAETLSDALFDVTIQRTESVNAEIRWEQIDVYCESGCVLELRTGGDAATGTTEETIEPLSDTTTASLLEVWSGSNSANDTLIRTYHIPADIEYPIDFSKLVWLRTSGEHTLTLVSTGNLSGAVSLFASWGELR